MGWAALTLKLPAPKGAGAGSSPSSRRPAVALPDSDSQPTLRKTIAKEVARALGATAELSVKCHYVGQGFVHLGFSSARLAAQMVEQLQNKHSTLRSGGKWAGAGGSMLAEAVLYDGMKDIEGGGGGDYAVGDFAPSEVGSVNSHGDGIGDACATINFSIALKREAV